MKKNALFMPVLLTGSLVAGCAWLPWNHDDGSQTAQPLPAQIVPHARIQDGADSAAAFYLLGRHLQREGRLDDAQRAYRRVLDFDPMHQEAQNALAVISAHRGDIVQAIAMLNTLVAAHPDQAHLLANLGYAHYLNGDYPQAKEWLMQALALAPDNESARQKLALVREKLGEPQDHQNDPVSTQTAAVPAARQPAEADDGSRNPVVRVTEGVYQLLRPVSTEAATPYVAQCDFSRPLQSAQATPSALAVQASRSAQTDPVAMPSSEAKTVIAPVQDKLRIELANGNGINRLARSVRDLMGGTQWQVIRVINHEEFGVAVTRIEYAKHRYAAARELADTLGISAQLRPNYQQGDTHLRVVLGHDFRSVDVLRERLATDSAPVMARLD